MAMYDDLDLTPAQELVREALRQDPSVPSGVRRSLELLANRIDLLERKQERGRH